jgi:hypothetical protein
MPGPCPFRSFFAFASADKQAAGYFPAIMFTTSPVSAPSIVYIRNRSIFPFIPAILFALNMKRFNVRRI